MDDLGTRRLVKVLTVIALAVVVAWTLFLARRALLLIYVSTLLAIGLTPLVRFIEHLQVRSVGIRRIPRWLAILVLYLAVLAAVAGLLLLILPPAVSQAAELWQRLPALLQQGQDYLVQHKLLTHPVTVAEAIAKAPPGGSAVSTIAETLTSLVGGAIGLVTLLILTFYLLVDRESIFEVFLAFVPNDRRAEGAAAAIEITRRVAAWLMGHLILGGVMGAATGVGLFLLGVPYFYVLAVLAAAGELIPIIGPLIAGAAAVAMAATVSPHVALATLVYFVILQQVEGNVLVPKIMERQVGLSPAAVMIALMIGGEVHGVVGAVLAMPTTAILKVVYQDLAKRGATRLGDSTAGGTEKQSG